MPVRVSKIMDQRSMRFSHSVGASLGSSPVPAGIARTFTGAFAAAFPLARHGPLPGFRPSRSLSIHPDFSIVPKIPLLGFWAATWRCS